MMTRRSWRDLLAAMIGLTLLLGIAAGAGAMLVAMQW